MPQKQPLNEPSSSAENGPSPIARIEVEKSVERLESDGEVDALHKEESLLSCTRILLREYGYRKGGGGDAVELPHQNFWPQQAVSALSASGFKTSFGLMKLEKIKRIFTSYRLFEGRNIISFKRKIR